MMEECEWLRFVFFCDESHQEVIVIDKLVLDKQVKAIETFCNQYAEHHGIDLPFCSVILFETVEAFLYKQSEEDFYLHFNHHHSSSAP